MPKPRKSASAQTASSKTDDPDAAGAQRLQKVLAAAGIGSRRECEQLILDGRVEVDRRVVTELGTRVDPAQQQIRVDGDPIKTNKRLYYLVNKPTGVVSTNRDPEGRPRAVDLVATDQRLFLVGRLDRSSEGLLLLTNDGDLANRLMHPRYGIEKTYHVRVAGHPTDADLAQMRKGVYLAEGFARVANVKFRRRHKESTELEIVLNEGRNREIRRLLARIGHKVLTLKRVTLGPLHLADLPTGAHRPLTSQELKKLRAAATGLGKAKQPRRRSSKTAKHAKRPINKPPAGNAPRPSAGTARSKPPMGTGAILEFEETTQPPKNRSTKKKSRPVQSRRKKSGPSNADKRQKKVPRKR